MGDKFLDKVENNAAVRKWSKITQLEKADSLAKGYKSELWDYTRIRVTQNNHQELKEIWDQWDDEYWNPAYSCFTFGRVDLVPTVEEYIALLTYPKVQVDKAYSRAAYVPAFSKKLMNITGMSEQWVTARIKQKGECKCIPWKNLRDLILTLPDMKKKVDVFPLSIYRLMFFPRVLGYVDEAVTDLFDRLDKEVTPVPTILAETFRSLNACRRTGEGRFIRCAQLLLVWFHSHFWKIDKGHYRAFFGNYYPLKEIAAIPRRDDILKENWIALLRNLQGEDIEWKAPWWMPNKILFRCESFDWVPLLGIWGAIGYAPLLVLRQYAARQFISVTHGLAQCKFLYKGDYKKRVKEISNAWNQTRRVEGFAADPIMTPEYDGWLSRRVNDNIPGSSLEGAQLIEEYLRVVPSELEIINRILRREKLDAEKLRKGKRKAKEDLDSLKNNYKELHMSMRTAGLGKTSKQWQQEIQKEKSMGDQWKRRFCDARARKEALKRTTSESQSENETLRAR
ncbi:hypothetical protein CXB51_007254 [Gossypium anomalum]|uniref:DUF7745 domain-containing protein n=1 Tax=Gossypium anomalum TaxID=47600 RepID=A0A8J5ZCD5_9ROSI|nr:hypothetical protein CXB51_007254 [Gossypium anomalum]